MESCENGCLIIRRTVNTAGGGKRFVGMDRLARSLFFVNSATLVDLHGPHNHQSLFSRDQQLLVLDAFAAAESLRVNYVNARKEWLQLVAEKKRLSEDTEAIVRETELLSHQVDK